MSAIPRLVNVATSPTTPSFSLTAEFQFIIDNNSSSEWLLLLRNNWQHYSRYIISEESIKDKDKGDLSNEQKLWLKSQEDLRELLSSKTVECLGGITARLGQTCLPRGPLKSVAKSTIDSTTKVSREEPSDWKDAKRMPQKETRDTKDEAWFESVSSILLDIPDPDDPQWDFLKHFGVLIKLGAEVVINRLRCMRYTRATLQDISKLYDQIQGCSRHKDIDLIRYVAFAVSGLGKLS